jgi:DNA-binding GntR family transcriptional regulator
MLTVSPRLPGENNLDFSYRVIKEGIMSLQLVSGETLKAGELAEALHRRCAFINV